MTLITSAELRHPVQPVFDEPLPDLLYGRLGVILVRARMSDGTDTPTLTAAATLAWRVMVIDDDADIRLAFREVFLDLGCEVTAVAGGDEAPSTLRSGAPLPNVVLVDPSRAAVASTTVAEAAGD